jgi:xanthine dehydrogenase accessory factor
VLENERPIAVRRAVAFSEAVYEGKARVEEVEGVLETANALDTSVSDRTSIPVVVDPEAALIPRLRPAALVDAIMAKRNVGTTLDMAPTVVALGPGFTAAADAHAVVETQRGPHLGRVIWCGAALPNTGTPGEVGGRGSDRVLRAPTDGTVRGVRAIGDLVNEGEILAFVGEVPVPAPFASLLRGLIRDGVPVTAGMKIGDIDPRRDPSLARLISDKSLAIAGGVLEAILSRGHR